MPPGIRDRIKTRAWKLGEVFTHNAIKSGQANSQVIVSGAALVVGTTNTQVGLTAGEVILGQAPVSIAAIASQALPAGAAQSAGQFKKILCEVNAAGVLSYKVGNIVSTVITDAVLPDGDIDKISVGWIEVSGAFVVGTTVVTSGMLQPIVWYGASS